MMDPWAVLGEGRNPDCNPCKRYSSRMPHPASRSTMNRTCTASLRHGVASLRYRRRQLGVTTEQAPQDKSMSVTAVTIPPNTERNNVSPRSHAVNAADSLRATLIGGHVVVRRAEPMTHTVLAKPDTSRAVHRSRHESIGKFLLHDEP
jgi:hypothetical protein